MHQVLRAAVPFAALAVLAAGAARAEEPQHNLRPQGIHADITLQDGSKLRVDTAANGLSTSAAGVVTVVSPDGTPDVAVVTCTAALHGPVGAVTGDPAAVVSSATGAPDAVFTAFSAGTGTTYYGFLAVRTRAKTPYAALTTQPDYGRCGSPLSGRQVTGTVTITY